MIGGGGQYQSLGMETSSHGHGGSITEDFVSPNLLLGFGDDGVAGLMSSMPLRRVWYLMFLNLRYSSVCPLQLRHG